MGCFPRPGRRHFLCPRQPHPHTFAGTPAHKSVFRTAPFQQDLHLELRKCLDQRPHGKFSCAAFGQFLNKVHGLLQTLRLLSAVRLYIFAYKDLLDPQADLLELMLGRLYAKWSISDQTDFSALAPEDYPILSQTFMPFWRRSTPPAGSGAPGPLSPGTPPGPPPGSPLSLPRGGQPLLQWPNQRPVVASCAALVSG